MLDVAVARSSSNDSVICYVFRVLWMTPCFHIMEAMGQNERVNFQLDGRPESCCFDHDNWQLHVRVFYVRKANVHK